MPIFCARSTDNQAFCITTKKQINSIHKCMEFSVLIYLYASVFIIRA